MSGNMWQPSHPPQQNSPMTYNPSTSSYNMQQPQQSNMQQQQLQQQPQPVHNVWQQPQQQVNSTNSVPSTVQQTNLWQQQHQQTQHSHTIQSPVHIQQSTPYGSPQQMVQQANYQQSMMATTNQPTQQAQQSTYQSNPYQSAPQQQQQPQGMSMQQPQQQVSSYLSNRSSVPPPSSNSFQSNSSNPTTNGPNRPTNAPPGGQSNPSNRSNNTGNVSGSAAASSSATAGSSTPATAASSSSGTIAATPAQLKALTQQINSVPPGFPWMDNGNAPTSNSNVQEVMPTLFGNDQFTEEESTRIQLLLERKMAAEEMATRTGGGKAKLYYVETHAAINFANYIFDYNGWSSSIREFTMDYLEQKGDRWFVGLSCIIKVMLKDGTYHEDIGYGSCANMPDRGAALEKAKKEAASDALKRALRLFGNGLGNCIYDKDYLSKLGKGQIITAPLDLSANRPRKRNRFMPTSKEEMKNEEQQPHRPQPLPPSAAQLAAAASAAAFPPASAQISPKVNKPNVYAAAASAAHQQVAASSSVAPAANPYLQAPMQPPPGQAHQPAQPQTQQSPQWNSPVVKQEMASPVISANQPQQRPPTSYANVPSTSAMRPNVPTNNATAPPPNPWVSHSASTMTNAAAPATAPSNPWQQQSHHTPQQQQPPLSSTLPLQSNFAQQLQQQAHHQQPQPQSQQFVAQTQPSAVHTPIHPLTTAPSAAPPATQPHAPQAAPQQRTGSYTPPSSFSGAPATTSTTFPRPAPPVTESKVDNDLDEDMLINMIEQHSPQKQKDQTPPTSTPTTTTNAHRQLQMDEQKENRPSSMNCSPVATNNANKQPQAQSTANPEKSPIFSVADLLDIPAEAHDL